MESEPKNENPQEPEANAFETEATKAKKSRLIVRNLIYDIKDHHLRALFSKFGKITDINIPLNPSTNSGKGFAFIQLENKNQSLKAIKDLNEKQFKGRTILLDLACDKRRFELNKPKSEENQENKPKLGDDHIEEESIDDDEEDSEEEIKKKPQVNKKNIRAKSAEPIGQNNKKTKQGMEIEQEDAGLQTGEGGTKNNKNQQTEEDLSTSAFVRNISFETTEQEFREYFSQFGTVKMAKLVKNHETGSNKGTGFIKFSTREERDAVIKISDQLENREMNPIKSSGKKKAKDDSSGFDLELGGRRMIVLPTITKASANEKIVKESEETPMSLNKVRTLDDLVKLDRNNKRKIHLAKIGLFDKKEEMNDFETDKRDVFLKEKIEKLRNPNFFVSETRVALKNLPKRNFGDDELKEITKDFVLKKFSEKERKTKRFIKQLKVLMEKDFFDKTGLPKSKGIGFIEFINNDIALKFMDYITEEENFKKMSSTNRIPIVEFAIEDIRKMRKRDNIKEKNEKNNEEKKSKKENLTEQEKKALDKKLKEKKNVALSYKILLQEMIDNPDVRDESKAKEYLKKINLRGLRQKIKKKVERAFGHKVDLNDGPKKKSSLINELKQSLKTQAQSSKPSKEQIQAEKEHRKQERLKREKQEAEERKVMKKIKNTSKNKKKEKRKAEEHDEFDEMAEKYAENLRKKVKWSS